MTNQGQAQQIATLIRLLDQAMSIIAADCYSAPPTRLKDVLSTELYEWWTAHKEADRIHRHQRDKVT